MEDATRVPPEPWTLVVEDSERLLEELAEARNFSPDMQQVARRLLLRLAASGHVTREPGARRVLRNKLTYWASQIRSSTGELIHPPDLRPASDGSGLAALDPSTFVKSLKAGERIDAREIQGARFSGQNRHFPSQYVGNSYLLNCDFERFKVSGSTEIVGCSLLGCKLASAFVETLTANDSRFLGAEIRRFTASKALLRSVRMPHSIVTHCELPGAVFDNAKLGGGDQIDDSDRPDIEEFGLARPSGDGATVFEHVDLHGASFCERVSFNGTRFEHCNLRGARFTNSDLARAIFVDCDFDGAEFAGSVNGELASVTDSRTPHGPDPRVIERRPA